MTARTPLDEVNEELATFLHSSGGRVIDNPYQPGNRDANSPFPLVKVAGLGDRPFPTGK